MTVVYKYFDILQQILRSIFDYKYKAQNLQRNIMNDHFVLGFTIKDTFDNKFQGESQKSKKKSILIDDESQQIDEQSNDDMLFKIGGKNLAEQKHKVIDIDQDSSHSDDSDKTVNLKQKRKKIKHQNKHKKEKDKKDRKNKKHHKHDQNYQNLYSASEVLSKEEGEVQEAQLRERQKKQKKIKKHKQKNKDKKRSRSPNLPRDREQKVQKIDLQDDAKSNKKVNEKQVQRTESQLFPSLINRPVEKYQTHQSLIPVPSHLQTTKSHQSHLYHSYLQKLTNSNLLPSRTIKQLSSQIAQKSEQFSFLYNNDQQRFQKQSSQQFITNAKFPDYLRSELKFDVIRFPLNEILTYGKHMNKEIPKYELIQNFTKVIGIKQKKQKKYQKIMKEIYRELNQKDFSYDLKDNKDKGNVDRYFHYEGYERIEGDNLVQKRKKLQMLRSKYPNKIFGKNVNESQKQCTFIPFLSQNKLFSLDHQLQMLESNQEQKFKSENRQLTQTLIQHPKQIQLWLKLVELQDELEKLKIFGFPSQAKTPVLGESQSMKIGIFVLEKKLTILAKGLRQNPHNELLGEMYFRLLFELLSQHQVKLESLALGFDSIDKVSTELQNYINRYPNNLQFWHLLLKLKLELQPIISLSINFNHTYVKEVFKQISSKITNFIQKQKSAQQIKKLRSISLSILQKIMAFYRKQGYTELSMAIGVSLVEFNLCLPQRVEKACGRQHEIESKKREFRKYWEDYKEERIGDLKWEESRSWERWDHEQALINQAQKSERKKIKSLSYIEQYISKTKTKQQNDSSQKSQQAIDLNTQVSSLQENWHFANPLYNKQRIKQSIQSLIMYEDIDQWLMNFRDTDSILKVIDILFGEGLGIRRVFDTEIQAKDNFSRSIEEKLIGKIEMFVNVEEGNSQSRKRSLLKNSQIMFSNPLHEELFQKDYWPPQMTLSFLCQASGQSHSVSLIFIKKLIYLSRILKLISQKVLPVLIHQKNLQKIYQLNEYRLFILGSLQIIRNQMNLDQKISKQAINLIQNLMQANKKIRDEVTEIIGWWEGHKQMFSHQNIIQNQNSFENPIEYDQMKMWAMYIEFEWIKFHYDDTPNDIQGQNSLKENQGQRIAKKADECLQCYHHVIKSQAKNQNSKYTGFLSIVRYYHTFINSITKNCNVLRQKVKIHIMIILSLISRNDIETDSTELIDKLSKQLQKLKHGVLRNLKIKQSKIDQEQNSREVSPIFMLELNNFLEELSDKLKKQQQDSISKGWKTDKVTLILDWLNVFVIRNNQIIPVSKDRSHQLIKLYSKRTSQIIQKHQNISNPDKDNIIGHKLDKLIEIFRIWKYLKVNSKLKQSAEHIQSTDQIVSIYEQLLLLQMRQIELVQSNVHTVKSQNTKQINNELVRVKDIFISKLNQFYHQNVKTLKICTYRTSNIQAIHANQSQQNLVSLIDLTISLLKCISANKSHPWQLVELKQIMYPLLIKYPYCKKLYLQYITLIVMQLQSINQSIKQNSNPTNTKNTILELEQEITEIYQRMNSYGIRIINKHKIKFVNE